MKADSRDKALEDIVPREVRVLVVGSFNPNLGIVDLNESNSSPKVLLLFRYGHFVKFMVIAEFILMFHNKF